MKNSKLTLKYFLRNFVIVACLVMIWRGVWYILDEIDKLLFGGSNVWTVLVSIILGLLLLCLVDKDLKAIEKL